MEQLRRIVLLVALAGIGLQVAVAALLHSAGPIVAAAHTGSIVDQLPPYVLVTAVLLLVVAGDLVAVPVRRGEEVEELTLNEAALVVGVLLLPAAEALWVSFAGIAIASTVTRRDPLKSAFNLGSQGAGAACLVAIVHLVSGPGQGLTGRTVLAVVAGLLVFSLVNLTGLTRVLAVLGEADAPQVMRDGLRLALVSAVATVAVGGSGVLAATHAPALLPFALVPAVALLFAFRATAQAAEQRQRSARLLALSHVLAGRVDAEAMLPAFLSECRQVFGADVALTLLDPTPSGESVLTVDDGSSGPTQGPTTEAELLAISCVGSAACVLAQPLPHDWVRALAAPLEADGVALGMLVVATRHRGRPLGAAELTLLTPLASALAVALRGAAHLRRLTEATSKLQAVVDQSSDGILVLDGAGVVQLWSPALARLSGRSDEEAAGRPLASLVRVLGADGAAGDPFLSGASLLTPDSPQATVELTLLREDGEERVVRCAHAGAFVDGLLTRDVVIVHDVTRERQVERLKADFIATVSHELRTPVTPIKGYADLLRRKGDDLPPEKRAEYLAVISDRSDHLARLVEDLLLASRISATEGRFAQVEVARADLVALVRRAAGDFGDDGARLSLVVPDGPVAADVDPLRTVQVLTNLIGNALKYSTPGSPVEVRVTVDPAQAHVDVVDRGRGIPADQLERVFEKFHRVEDPMRMTTGGTGLGLYIARQLATAMGGALACTSTLGAGSTFRFSVTLAKEALTGPLDPPVRDRRPPLPRRPEGADPPLPRPANAAPAPGR